MTSGQTAADSQVTSSEPQTLTLNKAIISAVMLANLRAYLDTATKPCLASVTTAGSIQSEEQIAPPHNASEFAVMFDAPCGCCRAINYYICHISVCRTYCFPT